MAVDEAAAQTYAVLLEPGNGSDEFYVAMRRLLLARKASAGKLQRQTWKHNELGYAAYRDFLRASKRGELSAPNSPALLHTEGRLASPTPVSPSAYSLRPSISTPSPRRRESPASPLRSVGRAASFGSRRARDLHTRASSGEEQAGYTFGGIYCIFDDCKASVNCIKFGRLSSDLFAYGAANGMLRVCRVSQPPRTLHTLKGHTKEITDFDWSLSNHYLCSASLDKSVRVWDTGSGECLRIIYGKVGHLCIRFHPVNNNLLLVGSTNDELTVINFSTGRVVSRLPLEARITAMDVDPGGRILFAGDSRGCVHSVQVDPHSGALQHMHRNHMGIARGEPATAVQFRSFSRLAKGAVLLACNLDGSLRYFSAALEVAGYLSLKCSLQLAPRARHSRASFCPAQPQDKGELIVTGSDDHNVYFYDFAQPKHPLVGKLQGHGAPVVDVCWNHGENLLATSDCDGLVVVWRRNTPR